MANIFENNKTKVLYKITDKPVTNATNAQDGEVMILYENKEGELFIREWKEFHIKFTQTNLESL